MLRFFFSHWQATTLILALNHFFSGDVFGARLENGPKDEERKKYLATTTAKAQVAMRWCFYGGEATGRRGGRGGGSRGTRHVTHDTSERAEAHCDRRAASEVGLTAASMDQSGTEEFWLRMWFKYRRRTQDLKTPDARRFTSPVTACYDVSHQLLCMLVNAYVVNSSFVSLFFSSSVLFTLKSTLYLYCEERFINKVLLTYLLT